MGQKIILIALVALVAACSGRPAAEAVEDNFCQGCRSLVSIARRFNSSEQRADVEELFKGYCELYNPPSADYRGPCPMFVSGLFYVLDHMDPIHHCDQIGACDPAEAVANRVQPSDDIYEYLESSNTNDNNQIRKSTSPKRVDNIMCEFCEQTVQQFKDMLEDPAFVDKTKRQIDGLCRYLAVAGYEKQCRQYMDKYIDQLFYFIQNIKPKQYCQSIQLCRPRPTRPIGHSRPRAPVGTSASDELAQLPSLADFQNFGIETSVTVGERARKTGAASSEPASQLTAGGPGCMLCKTVVKELFHFIRENKTEANIIKGLEQVCSLIYSPGTKRDQCDSMVKAYTRELVQLMIDETDPEVICMLLEQCTSEQSFRHNKAQPDAAITEVKFGLADLISALDHAIGYKSPAACFECKIFLKFLKEQIDQPHSRDQIEQWLLNKLCNQLPDKKLVGSCTLMVKAEANNFFQALSGLLSTRQACVDMGVCAGRTIVSVLNANDSSSQSALAALSLIGEPIDLERETRKKIANRPSEFGGQMCDQCVEIVSQIDDYLSQHPIDQDVSVIIDKVCNKLPEGSARGECTYIIKTFGAEIVQAISNMNNPRQLCSKIYLCRSNSIDE